LNEKCKFNKQSLALNTFDILRTYPIQPIQIKLLHSHYLYCIFFTKEITKIMLNNNILEQFLLSKQKNLYSLVKAIHRREKLR